MFWKKKVRNRNQLCSHHLSQDVGEFTSLRAMDEVYVNVEQVKPADVKPPINHTGRRTSEGRFHRVVAVVLGLLSLFLLVGLIVLSVHYHDSVYHWDSDLSNLTEERDQLNSSLITMTEERDQLNSSLITMTEERDQLNSSLIAMTEKFERLQYLSKQKKSCPAGWTMNRCSCYLLSTTSGSWETGRNDCKAKGADLVVIDSNEEQTFVVGFTSKPTWIGLNDLEEEGVWKWVDETPLTVTYWNHQQPDNGGRGTKFGEEDCAQIRTDINTNWNDLSCSTSLNWLCEKSL